MEKPALGSPSSIVEDYNIGNEWLFKALELDENAERAFISGHVFGSVLEIGCGTGRSTQALYHHCKKLVATDVIPEFVEETRRLMEGRCEVEVCDVHKLQFESLSFDCVFHFGAFNTFRDPVLALQEMCRVAQYKVIIGDEGLAPWLRDTTHGRTLIKANPLYLNTPPLHLVPYSASNVRLDYVMGGAFWLLQFTKGYQPSLELDLPIPGPRGGTLRTRLYGT
jgi:SAM-dependent methyltransferase